MWLLDNLYSQSKEVTKNMFKLDDTTWLMKCQVKVDKFSYTGVLCCNCLSKLQVKVEIYRNMVEVVKAVRENCWTIYYFSLIRDVDWLHTIEFEDQLYR